jgi:hypothetical protein
MGKLGVGIGDEFPVEDPQGASPGSDPGSDADPEYEKMREEYRKARDAWREQRRKMRDAWRARRRAYSSDTGSRYGDGYAADMWHEHGGFHPHHIANILLIAGLIMLAVIIFSHIYLLFGLVVLAGLYFAYRGGFDHHFDLHEPPRSTPPSSPPGAAS